MKKAEREIMIEAHDVAMIKTEEDYLDFGIIEVLYDGTKCYTEEAKKCYREHYDRELKRLSIERNIKLSEI